MLPSVTLQALERGSLDTRLAELYGAEHIPAARQRLQSLLTDFENRFGAGPAAIISAPGRTEISGNHTDHNGGHVLAAAVDLDLLAVVRPVPDMLVELQSDSLPLPITVNLTDLNPQPQEQSTSSALIRGVADHLRSAGYAIGGFQGCVHSLVPVGSGLSSSAAFEVLISQIFNFLYNDGFIPALDRARAGLHAENVHFGKPCGFMDQMACAVQGLLCIDFKDSHQPDILELEATLQDLKLHLLLVNAGGSHADLTPEYAAIPAEMRAAARVLGQERARGLTLAQVRAEQERIRAQAGDRALLRLLHFVTENQRAQNMAACLQQGNADMFLCLFRASGQSSWNLLQNCQVSSTPQEQPVPVSLALAGLILGNDGACRVHGGGFAGTIQILAREQAFARVRRELVATFGARAVMPVRIRRPGLDLVWPPAPGALP